MDESTETGSLDWKVELSSINKFLVLHRAHIGGATLLLSALCIFHYASREQVPINLTSSTTFISLPAVFVSVACIVIALVSIVLAPTLAAFVPPSQGRSTLMARMHRRRKTFSRGMRLRFFSALAIPGMLAATVVIAFAWLDSNEHPAAFNVALVSAIVLSWLAFIELFSADKSNQRFLPILSVDFCYITLAAGLIQMLVWLVLLKATIPMFLNSRSGLDAFSALAIVVMLALASVQIIAALLFSQLIRTRTPVTHLLICVGMIVTLACILPPSGSALAGYVIRTMASGNRACVVMAWSKEGLGDRTLPSARPQGPTSVPLRIMAETDGIYLARKHPTAGKDIVRIPSSAVREFQRCPRRD